MAKMTIEERVLRFLERSDDKVFIRSEFDKFGGYDQVGRVLRSLVKRGLLIKAGYGVYVKTRVSSVSGRVITVASLDDIGFAVLEKIGVKADIGSSAREYRLGKTTQIPMAVIIDIGKSRTTRKIGFGVNCVRYEHFHKP